MRFFPSIRARVALLIFAIALVSALGGAVVGYGLGRKVERQRNLTAAWNEEVMHSLQHHLKPDEKQVQAWQAAIDRAIASMQVTREQAVRDTDIIVERLIEELRHEMKPEQKETFEKLVKRRGATTLDLLNVKEGAKKK